MVLARRRLPRLAVGALAMPALARTAAAQAAWPTQPVRFVVGHAAGQAIDILARRSRSPSPSSSVSRSS